MKIKIEIECERVPKSNPRHCFQIGNTSMANLTNKYDALMSINRPQVYGITKEKYEISEMIADGFTFGSPQTKDWGEGRTSTTVLVQNKALNFSCFAAVANENFTVLEVRAAAVAVEKYGIKPGDCKGYLV